MVVRCNSCTAKNELVTDAPEAYDQYGKPHIDLPAPFSCCECGRRHCIGTSVELIEEE